VACHLGAERIGHKGDLDRHRPAIPDHVVDDSVADLKRLVWPVRGPLKTVRSHVSNIFAKLQVADRAEAIIRARPPASARTDKFGLAIRDGLDYTMTGATARVGRECWWAT
jgi:Bacterial regulatory proteins, luxR family